MNEHLPDDELLSSILDGEADDAARALVEADPALGERLAELQQVSAAVRSAPAVASGDMREQAISAALTAWTVGAAATEPAAAQGATVTPLVRPGRNPWLLAAAAAAAVVVLLPLGLFVAGNIGDQGSDSSEVAIPVDEDDDEVEVTPRSTTPPGSGEDPSDDDRTPGPTRGVVAHLGDLPDTAAVANAVANYRATGGGSGQNPNPGGSGTDPGQTPSTTTTPTQAPPPQASPSDPGSEPQPNPGAPAGEDVPCPDLISGIESVELLSASFQGIPSLIMVRSGDDSETALVIDTSTCKIIAEVTL